MAEKTDYKRIRLYVEKCSLKAGMILLYFISDEDLEFITHDDNNYPKLGNSEYHPSLILINDFLTDYKIQEENEIIVDAKMLKELYAGRIKWNEEEFTTTVFWEESGGDFSKEFNNAIKEVRRNSSILHFLGTITPTEDALGMMHQLKSVD